MSGYLGLDTSNYTTSAAYWATGADMPTQAKQLLPVKEGEMGLRQADAVFHHTRQLPEVMERLAASPVSAVTVDSTLPLPEKDFKGRVADGMLCEVGVNVFGPDCIELQPAYLLKSAQTDRWLREIAAFVSAGNDRVYAENAFNAAWREIPIRPLDVQGLLCAEIDNQADKEQVSQRFAKECQA